MKSDVREFILEHLQEHREQVGDGSNKVNREHLNMRMKRERTLPCRVLAQDR